MRQRWIQIDGELVPADEAAARQVDAPFIQPDIEPYQSMATGEMISSRSQHREHLKAHGLIEIGNETKYLQPKQKTLPPHLKETLARVVYEKLRY